MASWYCLWLFKCLWILHAILLLKIFAKSSQLERHGGWLLVRADLQLVDPYFGHVSLPWASWSLCNTGKHIVSKLKILALWESFTYWCAYSNCTKLYWQPNPLQAIVAFFPNYEDMGLHQHSKFIQQLLAIDFIKDLIGEPLDFPSCPGYIVWYTSPDSPFQPLVQSL